MTRKMTTWIGLMLLGVCFCGAGEKATQELDAQALFDKLTSLAGHWETVEEMEDGEEKGKEKHVFQVSAAGTVVMETMFPGTSKEMINMYHVDGDDLMLTHYCAGGNQPRMRLNPEKSSMDELQFDYFDGTNLDPEVDSHIHSGGVTFLGEGRIESTWISFKDGAKAMELSWVLTKLD